MQDTPKTELQLSAQTRELSDRIAQLEQERTALIHTQEAMQKQVVDHSTRESRYQALFTTMVHGVVYQDAAGRIIDANPAAERLLGLTLIQMQGRTSMDPRWRAIHEDGSEFSGEEHPSMVSLRTGCEVRDVIMGICPPEHKTPRWLNIQAIPQYLSGETTPYQVYTTFEDITERKRAEELLRESEQRLALTASGAGLGMFEWNIATGERLWNEQHARLLGIPAPATTATVFTPYQHDDWAERIHPVDLPAIEDELNRCVAEQVPYEAEYRVVWPDDSMHWLAARGVFEYGAQGEPLRMRGIVMDVTERKRTERELQEYRVDLEKRVRERTAEFFAKNVLLMQEIAEREQAEMALRDNEEKYCRLFENELFAISIFEQDSMQFLDVNDTFVKLYGYSREELLAGMAATEVSANHAASSNSIQEALSTGTVHVPLRYHKKKDGTVFPVEVAGGIYVFKGQRVMFWIVKDISERLQMEDKLRLSEERVSLALQGADLGLWDWNIETGAVVFNERWAEMLGYTLEEIEPHVSCWERLVHPQDMDSVSKVLNAHLKGRTPSYESEHRLLAKSGEWVWVLDKGKVTNRDEQGRALRMTGTHLDVTERKRAEHALKDSEERLHAIFDNSLEGIFFTSPEGLTLGANRAACDMLGWTEQELCEGGRNLIVDLTDPRLPAALEERRRTGRFQGELAYKRKDGTTFPVELSSALFTLHDGGIRAGIIFRDITERKRAEDERHQIAKTESLSRMAGAIAHNFNNLLAAIMGNLELALDDLFEGSNPQKLITAAIGASERAATISRLMLTYLGQTVGQTEPIDILRIIRETFLLFTTIVPAKVRLKAELAASGPIIKGNAAQLIQVLNSLITNSLEAIGKQEGEIVLKVAKISPVEIIKSRLFPPGWKPMDGEYVSLSIADTGGGIDSEHLDRIFDPFFTTKFSGRGLGLSVVPGLLKGFEGAISVESQPGQGTTFKLFFPVLERAISGSQDHEIMAEVVSSERKELLILVVDDESLVREMAAAMLQRKSGYQVITACDGFKALEIFKDRKEAISLVLLDLSMPGMNGWETLAALRRYRSDIPVVLTSGFDESEVMAGTHAVAPHVFLQKPYQRKDLLRAITTALQSPVERMQ